MPDLRFSWVNDDGIVEYNMNPGQVRAMTTKKRFILFIGGTRCGKSSLGAPWLLQEMMKVGAGKYLVAAPSFPLLQKGAIPYVQELFQDRMKLGQLVGGNSPKFMLSVEGQEKLWGDKIADRPFEAINFGCASKPDSLEAATYRGAWLDECGQEGFKVGSWQAIRRRLSTDVGRVLFSSTPYLLNWLYKLFYLPSLAANHDRADTEYINLRMIDNPSIQIEEYWNAKLGMPDWQWQMMYNGLFTSPAGLIYNCLTEDHFCPPFVIPQHWPRFMGQDYGGSNTCAVQAAQDPKTGHVYVYNEYLAGDNTAEEHIAAMTLPCPWSIPNDYFDIVAGGAPSEDQWRKEFTQAGMMVEKPGVKTAAAVEVGITRLYGLIKQHKISFFDTCESLRNDLYTYARKVDGETGEPKLGPDSIDKKAMHHFCDATRYLSVMLTEQGIVDSNYQVGGQQRGKLDVEMTVQQQQVAGKAGTDMAKEILEINMMNQAGIRGGVLQYASSPLALPSPKTLQLPW